MQSKRKNVDKRKIFLWCAAAGIVLCAVLFCLWHNRTALAEQRVERALSVTVSQPEPRLAQEDNTETGAWITVPGTNIDAPVQQASDNDYYLRRDTAGNADVHGCVFADYIRFKVNDLSGTKVAPMDLVIIIGNLLDNAIEACLKLPAGEREIYAQLLLEGTLFLSFRNTSPPVEIVNGYIATTKKPPDLHGFGLQNVKTALKKYDSFYDMAYEDGYFAFTIEMENDLPSATKNSFFAT